MKMNMKNPCVELKMMNNIWNANDASLTVKAAKSQDRPNRNIKPATLRSVLKMVLWFNLSSTLADFFIVCFIRTLATIMNITILKSKMANMGPKKTPKNTPRLLMKQLCVKEM